MTAEISVELADSLFGARHGLFKSMRLCLLLPLFGDETSLHLLSYWLDK
jgi:hypothetical protein